MKKNRKKNFITEQNSNNPHTSHVCSILINIINVFVDKNSGTGTFSINNLFIIIIYVSIETKNVRSLCMPTYKICLQE